MSYTPSNDEEPLSSLTSQQPHFLIFGAKGWIGSKVVDEITRRKNSTITLATSRADDLSSILAEIRRASPPITHIMSFIGRTHGTYEGTNITTIDYLEKPGKLVENIRDNLFSPLVLARICEEKSIHFTYLGTGCIFDYDECHPIDDQSTSFTEVDKPNFFGSSYSIVKGYTDQLMQMLNSTCTSSMPTILNVRIRMPITHEVHPRNFITKITRYDKVCSIPNSMTVLNNLLPILVDFAYEGRTGTINLTNPGTISHNRILEMYKEIVDPEFTWKNFSIEEQNEVLASKRSNNQLDTALLEKCANDKGLLGIEDAVRQVLEQMKVEVQRVKERETEVWEL